MYTVRLRGSVQTCSVRSFNSSKCSHPERGFTVTNQPFECCQLVFHKNSFCTVLTKEDNDSLILEKWYIFDTQHNDPISLISLEDTDLKE